MDNKINDIQVKKANQLIQKSRFELSIQQQKVIAYILANLNEETKKTGNIIKTFKFKISDYCKIVNITLNSRNYEEIKKNLKKLSDKSMWLHIEGGDTLVRWLSKVRITRNEILIELDEDLIPFLYNLTGNYTQYELLDILAMKSAFSIRLYEILKSYAYLKTQTFDLTKLREILFINDKYTRYQDLRRYVIEPAEREINEFTVLKIKSTPIKQGNKVIKIKFDIEQKEVIESYKSYLKVRGVIES